MPTLAKNPLESFKDDLMYSIDERFVDGLMEGRVITWQAKFFNYSRAVPRGPGLNGPLKNEKLQQEYIIFGIFATCLFGSIFTFFKFFTLRGCFEGLRDCFKSKDGGYKGRFSDWSVSNQHSDWSIRKPLKVKRSGKKEKGHDGLMATI